MLDHNRALKGRAAFAGAVPRGPRTRFLSITHLGFAGAMGSAVSCLTSGGILAVPDGIATAGALVEFIERHRVNNVAGSPVHAARLLAVARDDAPLLPGVRVFRMSSTVVPDALRAQILARITPNLYIAYGITEAGRVTVAPPELVRRIPGVVGYPQEGVKSGCQRRGLPAVPSAGRFASGARACPMATWTTRRKRLAASATAGSFPATSQK
jgi:acyl-CoA synthetase (AMP-forming)/AMP-acid ligase II